MLGTLVNFYSTVLGGRISPQTTGATIAMAQRLISMPQLKRKVLLRDLMLLDRGVGSNIQSLVLRVIEFCGGLWLRLLSEDLFLQRVLV